MSRSTSSRTVALICVAGLAFGACTDTVDADFAGPGSTATDSAVPTTTGEAEDGAEPAETAGSTVAADDEPDQIIETDPSHDSGDGSADEPEEPTLAMVEEEAISEAPAPEPPAEEPPELSDDGPVDVPQAELGAGESVLCGTVQIGIDAVNDGAVSKAAEQRTRILDGIDSIADRPLTELLSAVADSPTLDGELLADALDRCEALGYER